MVEEPRKKIDEQPKEAYSVFVTRWTGTAALISVAVLVVETSPPIRMLAGQVLRCTIMVWLLFGAVPWLLERAWLHRARGRRYLQTLLRMRSERSERPSAQGWSGSKVSDPGVSAHGMSGSGASTGPDGDEAINAATRSTLTGVSASLPAPYDRLPINPRPRPQTVLSGDHVGEMIGDALQLVGFPVEGDIDVLAVDTGPTLQTVSFKLPARVQLSALIKKREDLGNHLGHHSGFDVTASPHRSAAAFVVPHRERAFVYLRDVVPAFRQFAEHAQLPVMLGEDVRGEPLLIDLVKLPHLLMAGATGSGKSVCINGILTSLLMSRSPEQLRLLLIDPKQVELSVYRGFAHLLTPPVTDMRRAMLALQKVIVEMEQRYDRFAAAGVRNLTEFNRANQPALPHIVVVVDEYADLMLVAGAEVEDAIQRIVQMARAAGIHLVLATQRPSVNVVTGLIKANLPSRIAFRLQSVHDYKTVMDTGGPHLLGYGDGVCMINGGSQQRFQSAAISSDDAEVTAFIEELKRYWQPTAPTEAVGWTPSELDAAEHTVNLATERKENPNSAFDTEAESGENVESEPGEADVEPSAPKSEYEQALDIAHEQGNISITILQKRLRIGYMPAARLIERMEQEGIVGELDPVAQARKVLTPPADARDADLIACMKWHICRSRTARTTDLRNLLGIRKEKVLELMRKLVEEGFLEAPRSPKDGYLLALPEEEITRILRELVPDGVGEETEIQVDMEADENA